MSNLTQIESPSRLSRRDVLRRIAMAVAAAGTGAAIDPLAAQHVHQQAAEMKGALEGYKRQALTEHEWKTVGRLAELIVPADDKYGSAVDAGACEFIDLLCSGSDTLADIYHGGLGWLDAEMRHRYDKPFVECTAAQQTGLFDDFVAEEQEAKERTMLEGDGPYAQFRDYQAWDRSDLGAGVTFFDWVRKMSVDAYYTSPIGIKDLDYRGNNAYSEYTVPQEAIDYAMKRSPFASDD